MQLHHRRATNLIYFGVILLGFLLASCTQSSTSTPTTSTVSPTQVPPSPTMVATPTSPPTATPTPRALARYSSHPVLQGVGRPDDLAFDPQGHLLFRLNLATGKRETLARQGYIEPQGLATDGQNNLFVSDDYANIIMKYTPER